MSGSVRVMPERRVFGGRHNGRVSAHKRIRRTHCYSARDRSSPLLVASNRWHLPIRPMWKNVVERVA